MAKDVKKPVEGTNPPDENDVVISTFDEIVKKLTKECGRPITCVIKNVNYETLDEYTRVSFTLKNQVKGYRMGENDEYELTKVNVIFSSLYAIVGLVKEKEDYCWLGNAMQQNPNLLNLILGGATIKVIQQEVKENETYVNPFSTNGTETTFDHDTIINHVVDFTLSKSGERFADRTADKLIGF